MQGYQPQPTPTKVYTQHLPKVLVPNSLVSLLNPSTPTPPTTLRTFKEDEDQKPSTVKLESGHNKAILRKELKKDHQMNAVFQEIHTDFYLLTITENLFIENTAHFKLVIQQLAHDSFSRLEVPPVHISDNLMAMVTNSSFLHSDWLIFYQFARDLKSWWHRLKKHLLHVISPFYGIGSSVNGGVAQNNVELALKSSNFAFQSYNVTVSRSFSTYPMFN